MSCKVSIKKSTRKGKKMMAVFTGKCLCKLEGKKEGSCGGTFTKKTTHFGAEGMSDFTKHKDDERKARYDARHKKRENWNNPMTAGALSKWILWNKPTKRESIKDFKKRFNLV